MAKAKPNKDILDDLFGAMKRNRVVVAVWRRLRRLEQARAARRCLAAPAARPCLAAPAARPCLAAPAARPCLAAQLSKAKAQPRQPRPRAGNALTKMR